MGYPIIVRMDDICPRMDKAKFERYYNMLDGLGIKPLLGIIPCCEDESFSAEEDSLFWEKMRGCREKGYPIAMHGVHHVYTSSSKGLVCKRSMSEFAGLPLEEQIVLLRLGKRKMEENGLDTDIFMPPGHSYDINTLKAMKECGFRFLSDGRSFHPYNKAGIRCIPTSNSYRLHFNRGILTICIHSDAEDERSFKRTEKYLKKNRERIISFQEGIELKAYPYCFCRMQEKMNMAIDSALLYMIGKVRRK